MTEPTPHHDEHPEHDHGCDDALGELYRFLDGELDEELRGRIAAHLDECSPCLEAYDFEAELRKVVVERCQERVPDELRHRILAALEPSAGDEPR